MPVLDKLPRKFKNIPAFADLMQVLQDLSNRNIWVPAANIINLRDPDKIDDKYLALLGHMLGFNLQSNLLSVADYRRVLKEIVTYWSVSGTNYFAYFLGYLEGGASHIKLLWSNDYKIFTELPRGGTVYDGTGDWFITPHVNLYLTAGLHYNYDQVQHLFYQFAPITLVLESIDIPIPISSTAMNVLAYGVPKITYL